jgi:parallel beta-helix repeat protein
MGLLLLMGGNSVTLSESDFEALNEYNPSTQYNVPGVGVFTGATLSKQPAFDYAVGDLHVSKSGNDTTGDGSFANPYLTINKAFSVIAAAGGVTIWVQAGTYAENSGSGYFALTNKAYTNRVTVRPKPGDEVIVTNASGALVMRFFGTCGNVRFRNLTIRSAAGSTTTVNVSSGANIINSFEWCDCNFDDTQSNSFGFFCGSTSVSSNVAVKRCTFSSAGTYSQFFNTISNLRLIGNTFNTTSTGTCRAVRLSSGLTGTIRANSNTFNHSTAGSSSFCIEGDAQLAAASTLQILGNRITTGGAGISLFGGASGQEAAIDIQRNSITSTGNGLVILGGVSSGNCSLNNVVSAGAVGIGVPTDTGAVSTSISNVTIAGNSVQVTGATGHGLLVSIRSSSNTVRQNNSNATNGGAYGLVLKGEDHQVTDNTLFGGSSTGVYLKGADGCTVENNTIYQSVSGGAAIDFADDDLTKAANNTVQQNAVTVTDGKLYDFETANIGTGNVVNSNTYTISGSGSWGGMFGAAVNSLADVQASWVANYDVTTNDNASTAV